MEDKYTNLCSQILKLSTGLNVEIQFASGGVFFITLEIPTKRLHLNKEQLSALFLQNDFITARLRFSLKDTMVAVEIQKLFQGRKGDYDIEENIRGDGYLEPHLKSRFNNDYLRNLKFGDEILFTDIPMKDKSVELMDMFGISKEEADYALSLHKDDLNLTQNKLLDKEYRDFIIVEVSTQLSIMKTEKRKKRKLKV